eukprot:1769831-Pleurochrysis_carterae.AAC.1
MHGASGIGGAASLRAALRTRLPTRPPCSCRACRARRRARRDRRDRCRPPPPKSATAARPACTPTQRHARVCGEEAASWPQRASRASLRPWKKRKREKAEAAS